MDNGDYYLRGMFMKRLFCLVMVSLIMLNFNYVLAEEERTDSIDEFIFEVSEKKVIKQDDEHAVVSFRITNPTNEYYSELFYTPYMHVLIKEGKSYSPKRYIQYDPIKFELYPNEVRIITYDMKFPEKLPNMKYAAGFEFAVKEHVLSLSDELVIFNDITGDYDGFLIPNEDEATLVLGEDMYYPDAGPNINDNSKLQFLINVNSTFKQEKNIIPQFSVYRRSSVSNNTPFSVSYGEVIKIKPGEDKEIYLDAPKFNLPEAYLVKVCFVDETMAKVSQLYEFRYVVEGISANIGTITAKQIDNSIEVNTTVIGPADASILKSATILCGVYVDNKLISNKEITTDLKAEFYNVDMILENVNITNNTVATINTKVLYDGNVVTEKNQAIQLSAVNQNSGRLVDIKGTKYEEAVTALNSLGILNGYPDGTFKPENTITRAEFATIATKLGNYEIQNSENSSFIDVGLDHWAKDYINVCSIKGIVSGYLDGTFKPSNNVNYSESITILLNILGYKIEVNNSELNWPDNYLKKSEELGIHSSTDYIDFSLPATRGDIAILTYNAYLRR